MSTVHNMLRNTRNKSVLGLSFLSLSLMPGGMRNMGIVTPPIGGCYVPLRFPVSGGVLGGGSPIRNIGRAGCYGCYASGRAG